MNVREVLNEYISREIAKNAQPSPTFDQPLLDSEGGVIDSMSLWPLIVFIESHFDIKIEDTDLISDNFRTLRALTQLIESKHSKLS